MCCDYNLRLNLKKKVYKTIWVR